jgi:Rrf2 family protein
MWITKRTDYAGRALLALSLAGPDEALKLQEIATRTFIPTSVLEQVMLQLRGAGMVRSERGPSGGYRLNRRPDEITFEEVVRLFQGPIAPIGCATRKKPEPCPMEIGCSMRTMWQEIRDATIAILRRTTFADLSRDAEGVWVEGPRLAAEATNAAAG